jgi:Major intrinsic protein
MTELSSSVKMSGVTSAPVLLWRRVTAEFLGSAFLAAVVIGSGIAAQRLSPGQTGLELLENAAATAAGLFAIILMFGPVSGGHFNPVVSFVDAAFGGLRWREATAYLPAQVAGCIAGAAAANLMFALPAVGSPTDGRGSEADRMRRDCGERPGHGAWELDNGSAGAAAALTTGPAVVRRLDITRPARLLRRQSCEMVRLVPIRPQIS